MREGSGSGFVVGAYLCDGEWVGEKEEWEQDGIQEVEQCETREDCHLLTSSTGAHSVEPRTSAQAGA